MTSAEGRRAALEQMLTIRVFETIAGQQFSDGEIPGFMHQYVGQEAVAVGACGALEPDDYITSTHRGHGHCLAKGLDPSLMMAELYGKREGYNNGKGGSMHIADVDAGMLGANGIVGAGPPLATGAALTAHLGDTGQVALSFFGDGAVAQGQVHEAINMGATWDLPVIYLLENNYFGEGTPANLQHNVERLADTAGAYGIPGVTVDGMDVEAVYDAVLDARDRATAGDGPTFIEATTYRFVGHFVGDPEVYRDAEEVAEWRERDPVETYRQQLVGDGELTDEAFEELRASIEDTMNAALDYARNGTDPDPAEAYEDLFAEPTPELERQAAERRAHR